MARYQVTKSVDAKKLHPRSGIPLSEPPTLLPFGAILENLREERDLFKFSYLGQPYQCEQKLLKPAIQLLDGSPVTDAAGESPNFEQAAGSAPAPDPDIRWQTLRTTNGSLLRAKIPGGWLVMSTNGTGITFVPDAGHAWNGKTVE